MSQQQASSAADGDEPAQQCSTSNACKESCQAAMQQTALGLGEVLATSEQTAAAELGQLKIMDVHQVAERFWSDLQPARLSYVHHLAARAPLSELAQRDQGSRLPPNVQPSVLQHKLCAGSNRLSGCLLPTPTADGLMFNDMPAVLRSASPQKQPQQQQQQQRPVTPAASSSSSSAAVWQFSFSLLRATHVGPTGFEKQRQPLYRLARVCVFDRGTNRFIGNVHSLPISDIRHKGGTWLWDPAGPSKTPTAGTPKPRADLIPKGQLAGSPAATAAAAKDRGGLLGAVAASDTEGLGSGLAGAGGANSFIVRCAQEAADPVCGLKRLDGERLSLYIELNVAFKLTVEDAEVVPQAEVKGAGLVTELSTCWALVSLNRCAALSREMDISVPLYTGSIYQPGLLAAVWEAERKLHPVRSMFTAAPTPQLTFTAGPVAAQPQPLLAFNLMPSSMIARRDVAYLLAAARLATLQQLAAAAAAAAGGSQGMFAAAADGRATTAAAAATGYNPAVVVGFGDAALAALPKLLDDPLLLEELTARWWGRCRGLTAEEADDCLLSCSCNTVSSMPTQQQLVAGLKASVLEVAPLLHCKSMPSQHMTNFVEHTQHRAQVAAALLRTPDSSGVNRNAAVAAWQQQQQRPPPKQQQPNTGPCKHPVEVLSRSGAGFLHAPFDVAETRVCMADMMTAPRWSRC